MGGCFVELSHKNKDVETFRSMCVSGALIAPKLDGGAELTLKALFQSVGSLITQKEPIRFIQAEVACCESRKALKALLAMNNFKLISTALSAKHYEAVEFLLNLHCVDQWDHVEKMIMLNPGITCAPIESYARRLIQNAVAQDEIQLKSCLTKCILDFPVQLLDSSKEDSPKFSLVLLRSLLLRSENEKSSTLIHSLLAMSPLQCLFAKQDKLWRLLFVIAALCTREEKTFYSVLSFIHGQDFSFDCLPLLGSPELRDLFSDDKFQSVWKNTLQQEHKTIAPCELAKRFLILGNWNVLRFIDEELAAKSMSVRRVLDTYVNTVATMLPNHGSVVEASIVRSDVRELVLLVLRRLIMKPDTETALAIMMLDEVSSWLFEETYSYERTELLVLLNKLRFNNNIQKAMTLLLSNFSDLQLNYFVENESFLVEFLHFNVLTTLMDMIPTLSAKNGSQMSSSQKQLLVIIFAMLFEKVRKSEASVMEKSYFAKMMDCPVILALTYTNMASTCSSSSDSDDEILSVAGSMSSESVITTLSASVAHTPRKQLNSIVLQDLIKLPRVLFEKVHAMNPNVTDRLWFHFDHIARTSTDLDELRFIIRLGSQANGHGKRRALHLQWLQCVIDRSERELNSTTNNRPCCEVLEEMKSDIFHLLDNHSASISKRVISKHRVEVWVKLLFQHARCYYFEPSKESQRYDRLKFFQLMLQVKAVRDRLSAQTENAFTWSSFVDTLIECDELNVIVALVDILPKDTFASLIEVTKSLMPIQPPSPKLIAPLLQLANPDLLMVLEEQFPDNIHLVEFMTKQIAWFYSTPAEIREELFAKNDQLVCTFLVILQHLERKQENRGEEEISRTLLSSPSVDMMNRKRRLSQSRSTDYSDPSLSLDVNGLGSFSEDFLSSPSISSRHLRQKTRFDEAPSSTSSMFLAKLVPLITDQWHQMLLDSC